MSTTPEAQEPAPGDKPPKRKSFLLKDLSRVAFVVGFFVLVGWWLEHHFGLSSVRSVADVGRVTEEIRDFLHPDDSLTKQLLSYGYFLIGAMLLTGAGIPRWILCAVAGLVYGAVLGTGLSTVGTVAGAWMGYFMGKSMLKSTVRRRLGKRFQRALEKFREDGFGYTLHLRLMPGAPGLLTNLMAGACGVSFRDYTMATMVGYFPKTVLVCLLASGIIKSSWWQLAGAIALYIIFTIGHYYWKKRQKARLKDDEDDEE